LTISVVISTVNKFDLLRACIGYLSTRAGIQVDEVIVICDTVSDVMINYLYDLVRRRNIHLIINPYPVGAVRAWNIGFKMATKEYLVQLADDFFIQDNCILKLLEMLENNTNYGWVSALQRNYPKFRFTSTASMMPRKLMCKIDYYDELFNPALYEDADLLLKLICEGYLPHGCSDALVYHVGHRLTCGPLWGLKYGKLTKSEMRQQKKFKDKWGINGVDWQRIPVHTSKEKCTCNKYKIVKQLTGISYKQLVDVYSTLEGELTS